MCHYVILAYKQTCLFRTLMSRKPWHWKRVLFKNVLNIQAWTELCYYGWLIEMCLDCVLISCSIFGWCEDCFWSDHEFAVALDKSWCLDFTGKLVVTLCNSKSCASMYSVCWHVNWSSSIPWAKERFLYVPPMQFKEVCLLPPCQYSQVP